MTVILSQTIASDGQRKPPKPRLSLPRSPPEMETATGQHSLTNMLRDTHSHMTTRASSSAFAAGVCVCVLRLSKADAHVYSLRCLTKVHDRHFVSASIGDCPGDVGLTLETSQEISPRGPSVAAQTVSVTHQRQALNVALKST